MKKALLCVAVCVPAWGGPTSWGQLLVDHSMYGINTHVPSDALLAKLQSAGIAWARIDINWFQIQPSGPNSYNWGTIDAVVNSADARDIRLFATLAYTPGWANGNLGQNHLPTNLNDWKNFVRATVNRYRTSIKHWGLWNEPDLDGFLDAPVLDYVDKILIPGAQAIREADPTAMRIGPEVSGNDNYLEIVLAQAKQYLDIITVHKYGEYINDIMRAFDGQPAPWEGKSYKQILEDAGIFGTKPVWFTEVGWPTAEGTHVVTEAEQASNYIALLDEVRQRDWIDKIFFYEIADDPTPGIPKWGILRWDLSEKQAYGAYANDIAVHPPDAAPPPTEVSIDLGTPDTADGMTHPQNADGDTVPAGIGGRTCRRNDDTGGSPADNYFYFAVSDAYAFQGDYPEQYVMIEYYDTGSGSLVLQYDSTDPAPFPNDRYKNGGSVALNNTGTWKRHTYHVTDAYFGNRQNAGADFRIYKSGGGDFYLDRVRVARPPYSENPTAVIQADPVNGPTPLTVSFDGLESYDLDGTIVGYAWDFNNDGTTDSNSATDDHVYSTEGSTEANLTVTDSDGLTDSVTVTIRPGCTVSVSNLNRYSVATFSTGSTYFSDRSDTITSMPPYLEGSIGIKTADADMNEAGDGWITFDLDNTAEVYVAYDARATSIPGWLVNFVDTGEVIGVLDPAQGMAKLYRKIIATRAVSLDGNMAAGAAGAGSNYFVLVAANCTVPPTPGKATNPSPEHLATGVAIDPILRWTSGSGSESNDAYFGTISPGTFQRNDVRRNFVPGPLEYATTYYWRVDEINGSGVTAGDVWSFTTESEPGTEPVPAASTWGLLLMAVALPIAGVIVMRRRRLAIA